VTELRREREATGLSLYDVPRRMPVSTLRWAAIEAGLATPTDVELRDFAEHVKGQPAAPSTAPWANTATSPTSPRSRAA